MKTTQIFLMLFLCLVFINLNAQIDIEKKVENQANNKANKNVDQTISKGLNTVEDGVKGLFKKKKPAPPVVQKSAKDTLSKAQNQKGPQVAASAKSSLTAYSKYDFVPGDKVLLFEDFSQDAVGDFPALWTTDVAGEINTLNIAPGNWFNLKSTEGTYWFMKDIDFPKNFIIEFDIVPKKGGARYAADLVLFGEGSHSEMDKNGDPGNCGIHLTIAKTLWDTKGYKKGSNEKLTGSSSLYLVQEEKVNHVIVWVQNRRHGS